jgi:hypothetical protein
MDGRGGMIWQLGKGPLNTLGNKEERVEMITSPGAVTSGFNRPSRVGPQLLKTEREPNGLLKPSQESMRVT